VVLQDAFEVAQRFLDDVVRPEHASEIVVSKCSETSEGWAFGYDTREFLEQGDITSALVGNGPVIVPRSGEAPHIGSVFPPCNP
jgi:hypothetical protein